MTVDPHTAQELEVGQVFEGKYKILRELGRGGFGMVYLGFQEGMDRHVALKVLKSSVTVQAPSAKERFLREVKIISKLKHPNTVTIHDFGETRDGGLYMVLEYVEGETLKQILKRDGSQDPLRACELARQIARSLAEAHRHGVIHRDLKPANIMITSIEADKDFVKVLDFGVARLLDPKTNDLTSVGLPEGERELIGTPRYMSPEQVRGESLTGASDIYGLGLMLYEMICGEAAVQGDTTMGLITQQISPEPLKLPHARNFHPALQDIIRIATSKSVHERFQTAEQMADALEQSVFVFRRERSATGPQSTDVPMSSYQSQLGQVNSGWQPNPGSGWNPNATPSGNWVPQSGHYDQLNPASGSGPQFNPMQSGPASQLNPQQPYGSGVHQQLPANTPPGPAHGPFGPQQSQQHQHLPARQQQQQHRPQQQPSSPYHSGFNEVEFPDDEEFKPTIERDPLDPGQLVERPQQMFDRNQHPSSELPARDLPPVPQDERPFGPDPSQQEFERSVTEPVPAVDPGPAPADASLRPRRGPKADDESLLEFSISVLKACVLGTLALVFTYFAFLVIGAFFGSFFSGFVRLILSVVVALAFPGITILGETSQKDRFRVLERTMDRVLRILLGTTIFAAAAAILLSAAFSNEVVEQLQEEPNWYLSEPDGTRGFASFNRRVSHQVAGVVKQTMGSVGLYDPKKAAKAAARAAGVKHKKPLPAPTRDKKSGTKPSEEQAPKSEIPEEKNEGDGRYVDW